MEIPKQWRHALQAHAEDHRSEKGPDPTTPHPCSSNSTKFYAGSREWKLCSFQNDSQRHKERQEETLHSPGDEVEILMVGTTFLQGSNNLTSLK